MQPGSKPGPRDTRSAASCHGEGTQTATPSTGHLLPLQPFLPSPMCVLMRHDRLLHRHGLAPEAGLWHPDHMAATPAGGDCGQPSQGTWEPRRLLPLPLRVPLLLAEACRAESLEPQVP